MLYGLLNLGNTTFESNTANKLGGGLHGQAANFNMQDTLTSFSGNLAQINAQQMMFAGGIAYKRRVVSWDYTISKMDYIVSVQTNTLTSSVTLTLPSADDCTNGQTFVIKDEGGAANTHAIEVQCAGSDVIDGLNSVLLTSPYASIQLYCNGSNKYFIC